ncbi:hypothetical protein B0H10DRAFT_2217264 [Mycena sp. CBHHK59/15]|nr:hypothetical protein B0H10DRAFT_2217264 [Mycena sp. CBHHK59/15]
MRTHLRDVCTGGACTARTNSNANNVTGKKAISCFVECLLRPLSASTLPCYPASPRCSAIWCCPDIARDIPHGSSHEESTHDASMSAKKSSSGAKKSDLETFAAREVVLGKVRGFPPWPGMVGHRVDDPRLFHLSPSIHLVCRPPSLALLWVPCCFFHIQPSSGAQGGERRSGPTRGTRRHGQAVPRRCVARRRLCSSYVRWRGAVVGGRFVSLRRVFTLPVHCARSMARIRGVHGPSPRVRQAPCVWTRTACFPTIPFLFPDFILCHSVPYHIAASSLSVIRAHPLRYCCYVATLPHAVHPHATLLPMLFVPMPFSSSLTAFSGLLSPFPFIPHLPLLLCLWYTSASFPTSLPTLSRFRRSPTLSPSLLTFAFCSFILIFLRPSLIPLALLLVHSYLAPYVTPHASPPPPAPHDVSIPPDLPFLLLSAPPPSFHSSPVCVLCSVAFTLSPLSLLPPPSPLRPCPLAFHPRHRLFPFFIPFSFTLPSSLHLCLRCTPPSLPASISALPRSRLPHISSPSRPTFLFCSLPPIFPLCALPPSALDVPSLCHYPHYPFPSSISSASSNPLVLRPQHQLFPAFVPFSFVLPSSFVPSLKYTYASLPASLPALSSPRPSFPLSSSHLIFLFCPFPPLLPLCALPPPACYVALPPYHALPHSPSLRLRSIPDIFCFIINFFFHFPLLHSLCVVDPNTVPKAVSKERPASKKSTVYAVRFFPAGD